MALTSHHKDRRKSKKAAFERKSKFIGAAMYEGPTRNQVMQSIKSLVNDQIDQSDLPIDRDVRSFTRFLHAMDNFTKEFFDLMKNVRNSEESAQLAADCKTMCQECQNLADYLCRYVFTEEYELTVALRPKGKEDGYWLERVYYLPNHFDLFFIDEEEGRIEAIYHQDKDLKLGYKWLAQAIILLLGNAYYKVDSMFDDSFNKLKQLVNAVMSFGSLYQFMNPDDEGLDRQADATLDSLEEARLEYPEPPAEFMQVWEGFVSDLAEGKKEYVKEAARALKMSASYRQSKFTFDDYYISNKATSRRDKRYPKIRQSILASGYEERHHDDDPIIMEAEQMIGYTNCYNPDQGNQDRKDIISREIRNPGKYKGRLIKIGDNEMQDLGKYIMNRYKYFLSFMKCSCTEEQEKGLEFGLMITNPKYVESHHNNVYCWDWEDCTNNIAHWFDKLCFSLIFPELAPLWEHFCKYQAYHKYAKRGKEDRAYSSEDKGQPQGFGGSFDDMDWFHEVISMLEMKMTGRENIALSDFLRDLGDDDETNTVTPDPEKRDHPLYKDMPGYRTEVQLAFRQICSWVGLKINDSKCIFNEYDELNPDRLYEVEFAKVRIKGGKFDAPLPPRIAARYYQTSYQLIALNWQLQHGWTSSEFLDVILDREFIEPRENLVAKILYHSGIIDAKVFKPYVNTTYSSLDKGLLAVIKGSYYIAALRTSSIFSLISDRKNQFEMVDLNLELDSFKALISSPQLEEIWMAIENPDHKLNQLLLRNEEIFETVSKIFGVTKEEAAWASVLLVTDTKILDGYRSATSLMGMLRFWSEDTEDFFEPSLILNSDFSKITKACDVMLFKSARKRGKQELMISHKATQEALRALEYLPHLKDVFDELLVAPQ